MNDDRYLSVQLLINTFLQHLYTRILRLRMEKLTSFSKLSCLEEMLLSDCCHYNELLEPIDSSEKGITNLLWPIFYILKDNLVNSMKAFQ